MSAPIPRFVIALALLALAGIGSLALFLKAAPGATSDPPVETRDRPGAAAELACEVVHSGQPLAPVLDETSGLARAGQGDLFWTHNDSGSEPLLFGFGPDGALRARVVVEGADLVDWEDIEAAPCGDRRCLYVGDIGDNRARREAVTIYEVPEPTAGVERVPARAIRVRYPDGPRDAEGLFVHEGRLYVVSKGRSDAIRLYRVPVRALPAEAAPAAGPATLEPVGQLAPRPEESADYVTAATATPNGRWIALRTYRSLLVYLADRVVEGTPPDPHRFDLTPLAEPQGEGLALSDGGDVWMTSEGRGGASPSWSRLACTLP